MADRDIEKTYSTQEFVSKLRRFADALESGEKFVNLNVAFRTLIAKAVIKKPLHNYNNEKHQIKQANSNFTRGK